MITHDHKLIFVHIPKCAGRSICDIFNQRFDHYTAKYYELEFPKAWRMYQKMSIVRNPYDRLVSLYIYIKKHRRHIHEPLAANISDFRQWIASNIYSFNGNFNDLSAEGQRGTDGDIGSPFWFTSQWQRIIDHAGTNQLNRTFLLEDGMDPVADYLSEIIGHQVEIPHINASTYEDFRSFYDQETCALVSEFPPVKEDCHHFGYKF